ncbi:MAG TPA: TonB-dependent receptor [Steroidobacteraceae bacterium]|nr:TonB-dependent receptor [Steroidobacteraceae bacterium]
MDFVRPAVLAGLAIAAVPAQSQDAQPQGEEVETVVVSGIRSSLRDSLSVKRDSVQALDAISAEDIGDFPDKNVGEALQRVPGIQINRQDGEGRAVSIRGADQSLIRVEVNGVSQLSLTVGGGRDVDFRDIPVEFISRVEAVKTPTPEMTEGGIGTVRLYTRRPLDSPDGYLAGSVQGVYSDLAESTDPKVALIGSRTFFDGTFGVQLSGQWEQRHLNSNNARTTGWLRRAPTATGPGATPGRGTDVNADGTLDWIPEIPRYINDRRETTRTAFNGVLQWKPSESFELYLDSTYTKGREKVSSMLMQLGAAAGLIDYANTTVGADNTVDHIELTSSTAFPIDLAYRNINGQLEREQYNAILGGKWTSGPWTLDARYAYSRGEVQNDEKNSTATIFGVPRAIIDYTGGEGAPNFSFPGIDTTDGGLVNNLAAVFNPRNNNQEEDGLQFNIEFKPESLPWVQSIKAGYEQRDLTMESLLFARTIQISSRTPTPASSGATTTVAVPQATIANIVNSNSGTNSVAFFSTGDLGFPGGIHYWNDNGDATYAATIAASGLTLDPYGANANAGTNGTFQNYLDTWSVEEKTKAGYLQATFGWDEMAVPVHATVGVRYFDTNTLSSGFNRVQQGANITFPEASQAGGYNDWLPSINVRMDLTDKLVARVTAGDVMARPNPAQLAFRRSTDVVGLTGSRGNPDLLPFEARQYDAGLEYYFSDVNYVSAAYFRTEIGRFIINQATPETIDGLTYSISRPVNGTDKVTIDGFEIGGQYAFDFLPAPWNGFGVVANATFANDKGFKGTNLLTGELLPFPGLSESSYNASIYYENAKFSVRTAYNWRKEWLLTAAGRGGLPEFNEDYGTLDASVSWTANKNFTVFADVVNLLDEQKIENNNPFRRIGNETFGKRYFLGVRAKF